MRLSLRFSTCAALVLSTAPTSGAVISWTSSPAVETTEVNNSGLSQFAYAFSPSLTGVAILNSVPFTYVNTDGVAISLANTLTPGFQRFGVDSSAASSDDSYLGPNAQLNQILDGLTNGGDTQFQLNNLTLGTTYVVQLFSSDDRAQFINRVLDLDSSWSTPNGSRQLEDIDYTAGGPWTDPEVRQKVFTGTFTADASSQQILAAIDDGSVQQMDLNAIQLRSVVAVPEASAFLFLWRAGSR